MSFSHVPLKQLTNPGQQSKDVDEKPVTVKQRTTVSFIAKIGQPLTQISVTDLGNKYGFIWSDEIRISPEDDKRVQEALCGKDNTYPRFFEEFKNPDEHVAVWNDLIAQGGQMQDSLAIYDTGDTCGLGVCATNDIPKNKYVLYAGAWRWKSTRSYDTDRDYLMSLPDTSKKTIGHVDAKPYRNISGFIMHGWDETDLKAYRFSDTKNRHAVGLSNMDIRYIPRPKKVKHGPCFLLTIKTIQPIKIGQPLLCHYGDTFFQSAETFIDERFFHKNTGVVLPPSTYEVDMTYQLTIHYVDAPGKCTLLNVPRTFAETKQTLRLTLEDKMAIEISAEHMSFLYNKYNRHRFWIINLPADETDYDRKDRKEWLQIDFGERLRKMAHNNAISNASMNKYIMTMHPTTRATIINSQGTTTGKNAVHRAAEQLNLPKIQTFFAHGARKDLRTKPTDKGEGKTPYDLAKEKGASEELLKVLR